MPPGAIGLRKRLGCWVRKKRNVTAIRVSDSAKAGPLQLCAGLAAYTPDSDEAAGYESGGPMSKKRLSQRMSGTHEASDQPWSDHYDMSLLRRDADATYRLLPDPNSGVAITPLSPPAPAHRLAMLELWAPSITPASQRVITQHTLPNNPLADFANSAHLQVMGELTASIAHEICQPLLAIASNAAASMRWLQRENPVVSEAIEGLRDIRADCERAANIVAALRALTRQSPCNLQSVNVNDLIIEAVRLHGPALSAGNVALVVDLRADQPVIADPVQVQQLVFNLIANATEAMAGRESPGAIVRISSSRLPDGVQVSVEDNGPGIPVADRQRIFEAFHTTKESGLGMGLTICRSVVEAHKGNLYAEGSELGGAMIRFQLPTGCKNH